MNAISRPASHHGADVSLPKICKPETKSRNSRKVVPFNRELRLSPGSISEKARAAINVLNEEFEAVSHDQQATEALHCAIAPLGRPSGSSPPQAAEPVSELPDHPPALWLKRTDRTPSLREEFEAVSHDQQATEALHCAIAPLGRPSGSSPPQAIAPALTLPDQPTAWWRDRNKATDTPDQWLRTHYKPYIDAGLLTRSFFQRKGQDKAFYNGLLAWEQAGNQLPPDLHLPTKSELIDRQLKEIGGPAKAPSFYVSTPETRQTARLYNAARRRIG